MKTQTAKKNEVQTVWHIADAQGQILGRFACKIATMLRGKDTPLYAPHLDSGCGVVVINASQIKVTGKKLETKTYKRYSGYPGGLKEELLEKMLQTKPEAVIKHAVKGMLPKNRLGAKLLKRLKVYAGSEHPHAAQKPKPVKLT